MKGTLLRHTVAIAVVVLLATVEALCQTPGTGAIVGTVFDPSNHLVANADVMVSNDANHTARSVITTAEGVLRVPLLPPGTYTVTVRSPGFAISTARSVLVTVSETSSLNIQLSIAAAGASVEVEADAQVAELESSTVGGVVDETATQTLPLSNRNYTQILGLSPGVVAGLPNAAELGRGTQNVTSNGAKTTANNIQFNGIDANNLAQNSAPTPMNRWVRPSPRRMLSRSSACRPRTLMQRMGVDRAPTLTS